MKSCFGVRRTRHTAAMMLFVWLITLGIGGANACLVQQDHQSREDFSHSHSGTSLTAHPAHHVEPDHFATASGHSDDNTSSTDKATCLRFCAAEQNTLVTDHFHGTVSLAFLPVLLLARLLVPAADQTSPPQAFVNPPCSDPPVSILYSRLTI
jgi:hypothetical protein